MSSSSEDSDEACESDYFPWEDSGESDYEPDNYDYESFEITQSANKDDKSVQKVEDRSHSSYLCSALYDSLQQKDSHSDVVVIIDEKKFPAHKAVLSCACEYFKNMFSSSYVESTSKEIRIPGEPQGFAKLLKFIYTGHFSLSATTVAGVFKMASYMVFTKAMLACVKYLFNPEIIKALSIGDCFELWSVAKEHKKFPNLTQMFHTHVMNNFPKLCDSEVFLEDVTVELMLECLEDDEIETDDHDEEQVLRGAIKWLKHKWDQRKAHTTELMKKIRLGLIPLDKLKELLLELDNQECSDMGDEIVKLHGSKDAAAVPLKQSRPELFAPRNLVTAPLSLTGIHFNYQSEKACYRLEKMKSIPQENETDDDDILMNRMPQVGETSNYGFIVTSDGDLYVGGGQHWMSKNENWPYENNFFKYNKKENKWITLPPMVLQHKPEMFEHDGFIYSVGKAHSEGLRYKDESYDIQRYHMASKEWEDIELELDMDEDMYGIDTCFVHGRLLVLKRKRFVLYDPGEDKWSRVKWNKPPNWKKRPDMFCYKGNAYLVRNFKEEGRKRRDHIYRLECDFDQDTPTITETGEVDFKKELDLNVNQISKEDPRVCFTFDKRDMGVSKYHLYECPCHDVYDDLSRFWGPLP